MQEQCFCFIAGNNCPNSTAIHATNSYQLFTHSTLHRKLYHQSCNCLHVYCSNRACATDMSEVTSPDKSYKWYLILLQCGTKKGFSALCQMRQVFGSYEQVPIYRERNGVPIQRHCFLAQQNSAHTYNYNYIIISTFQWTATHCCNSGDACHI